jgi:TRAP-type C4-dicarboxylate transport system permease small subunit
VWKIGAEENGMKRLLAIWLKIGVTAHTLAGITLIIMFLVTLTEVTMRAVWRSIPGTFELISLLGGVVIGLAVPYTSQMNGHIVVDSLLGKLSKSRQNVMNVMTRIVVMIFFVFIAVSLISMGLDHRASKEVTQTLRVPLYFIFFVLGGVFLIQAAQFLFDIVKIYGGGHD